MIHYVLLTRDDVGRSVIDSRVIDVDAQDGLDTAGRVNAGIDLMLTAARDANVRVGPIGVAARTDKQRRELGSRGAGPRRQIQLVAEDEAVVEYLSATGQISRFGSVVVVDCGDTGMSLYTVDPSTREITAPQRSRALSGRALDRAIVDALVDGSGTAARRPGRRALLSACRTAKEEVTAAISDSGESPVQLSGGGTVVLTAEVIASAAAPMVDEARKVVARYISENVARDVPVDAVAFVGGLANLSAVQHIVDDESVETVVPPNPELAASVGAALIARAKTTSATTTRLAFIGGRRQREWLSATPLAVIAAILAATLMTVYAVSSALTGHSSPTSPSQVRPVSSPAADSTTTSSSTPQADRATTTYSPTTVVPLPPVAPEPVAPAEPAQPTPQPRWDDGPGWATTELPPTPQQPTTSTRTLSPYPLPSVPWPRGTTPTIPPELLPPGFTPPTTLPVPPRQRGAPNQPTRPTAPTTTTPTPDAAG